MNFVNAFSASTETIMCLLSYLMSLWCITLILHLLNQPCDAGVNLTWLWCMILFYVLLDLADILLSGFELIATFVYLAGLGLSCGPQDLYCGRRTQQLWPRALALQLCACVTWAPVVLPWLGARGLRSWWHVAELLWGVWGLSSTTWAWNQVIWIQAGFLTTGPPGWIPYWVFFFSSVERVFV